MGLDMYLNRKTYVERWEHTAPDRLFNVTISRGGKPYEQINPAKVCYVEEQVGYWRKANQIHAWFVDNVQEGKDDCGYYYVSKEQLAELLTTCQAVLKSIKLIDGEIINGYSAKAGEAFKPNIEPGKVIKNADTAAALLPTKSGFFFGSRDYDEWYVRNIEDTIAIIEPILALEEDDADYYYHSSW